jgi:Asp-tRNA(Asn)/Glu-tRNA(Gln) amidotransferase B subunit
MLFQFKFDIPAIEVRVSHHHDAELKATLVEIAKSISNFKELFMATKDEVLADLTAIGATVTKIGTETSASLAKIAELEALVAAGGVSQEIVDKVAEIKAGLTAVDDLVTDAPATPAP